MPPIGSLLGWLDDKKHRLLVYCFSFWSRTWLNFRTCSAKISRFQIISHVIIIQDIAMYKLIEEKILHPKNIALVLQVYILHYELMKHRNEWHRRNEFKWNCPGILNFNSPLFHMCASKRNCITYITIIYLSTTRKGNEHCFYNRTK